jgi:hypothetical protein
MLETGNLGGKLLMNLGKKGTHYKVVKLKLLEFI